MFEIIIAAIIKKCIPYVIAAIIGWKLCKYTAKRTAEEIARNNDELAHMIANAIRRNNGELARMIIHEAKQANKDENAPVVKQENIGI